MLKHTRPWLAWCVFLGDFGNGVGFSLQLRYIGLHRAMFLKRSFIYIIISIHLIFDFVVGNLGYLARQDMEMEEETKMALILMISVAFPAVEFGTTQTWNC